MNIAIDGPAGAGKSTIARLAAKELGFIYVDTGAMYRAIALYLLDNKTDIYDEVALKNALDNIHINIVYEAGVQHVFLDLQDVSTEIRSEKVGNMASTSSALPPVREKLLDLQRIISVHLDKAVESPDVLIHTIRIILSKYTLTILIFMSNITPYNICFSFLSLAIKFFKHIQFYPVITINMNNIFTCRIVYSCLTSYRSTTIML